MRNDRKINVSFSASAADFIRRFMKVAERTRPNANLVPVIAWWTEGTFTDKVTGKVTKLGPSIGVGAIDPKELTDELIVPRGGLKVAIQLPDELQSADRLKFDFSDGSFVAADNWFPISIASATLCLHGRIPDMFDGQKRAARKAKGKMRASLGF